MSGRLRVTLEVDPIERVDCDLALVSLFEDVRPPAGNAGRADWRLCGLLSELLAHGQLAGREGEAALVATAGRIAAPVLLCVGLGPRSGYDAAALERSLCRAFERIVALGVHSVALAPPGRGGADVVQGVRPLLVAALAALDAPDRPALQVHLCVDAAEEGRTRREVERYGHSRRLELVAAPAAPAWRALARPDGA